MDDTYNLDMLIRKMKNAHINYDMHNVFTILLFSPGDQSRKVPVGSKNLHTEFSEITVLEVAHSNEFYLRWARTFYFQQNLKLTYAYFQNNVSKELWEKTFEAYDEYDAQYKGGPLFFIIMINKLLSNTEEAAATLQDRVKHFKVTNLQGEDVPHAVSLLKGAIRRLVHVKRKKIGVDPEWFKDITRIVIKIMQTSSVEPFNNLFQQLEQQRLINQVLLPTGGTPTHSYLTYNQVFNLAEQQYTSMSEAGLWTGLSTKGGDSAFKAQIENEQK